MFGFIAASGCRKISWKVDDIAGQVFFGMVEGPVHSSSMVVAPSASVDMFVFGIDSRQNSKSRTLIRDARISSCLGHYAERRSRSVYVVGHIHRW